METVQQNGRFTLFSSKFLSIYSILYAHNTEQRIFRFGKHGLAINLVDSPRSMAVMKEIEKHFGKDIVKLDTEVISTSNKWYRLVS